MSSPVLVGRSGELSALDSALAEAGHGGPSAIMIGGEAGVGKSRLVSEFAERSRGAGVRSGGHWARRGMAVMNNGGDEYQMFLSFLLVRSPAEP